MSLVEMSDNEEGVPSKVQTQSVPKPRTLNTTETYYSICHWFSGLKAYYRRDYFNFNTSSVAVLALSTLSDDRSLGSILRVLSNAV